ncbi:MAG TPA: hypothetical protein VNF04_06480, partial [Stellaceae bacterium]|nr:hypothetical protein [Stellaceae bacterium]
LSTDDPADAVLLGVLTFSFPCAPLAIDGALVFAPICEEKSARASGRAEWARLSAADGRAIVDIDVSRIGGDGVIHLDSEEITRGRPIRISSFVIRAA